MMETQYAIPRAIYRLQLCQHLTFADVGRLADYFAGLGISHVHLSPVFRARTGSRHGYDVIEHGELNPELGTLIEFREMAETLKRHGIGIVLDMVPNHMAVGGADNRYWLDLLERGRDSRYAHWFDIDWTPSDPSLHGRVLVPMLNEPYDQAIRSGTLRLAFDPTTRTFAVWAHDTHKLPLDPRSYGAVVGDLKDEAPLALIMAAVKGINDSPAALDALIARQHWRIEHHTESRRINYRRFFTVNDLAGIRVELDDVFDHVHRLVFRLVGEGLVDGLRIDHIDGLYDPEGYCHSLRQKSPRPVYIAVEKILAPHERLAGAWRVDGTTGYEFGARVVGLLAEPSGEAKLSRAYAAFTTRRSVASVDICAAKLEVLDNDLVSELEAVASRLQRLLPDLSYATLRAALRRVIAGLGVYRTYIDEHGADDRDYRTVTVAIARARKAEPEIPARVFDQLAELICRPCTREHLDAVRRLQQLTGPVMAKGLEDRALYRYNRLIALNDVGTRPDRFSISVASLHDFNRRRMELLPHGMLASSSHDSKRGEDARARIVALSSNAGEWAEKVVEWRDMIYQAGAPPIDANQMWYFFQQLLGAWPVQLGPEAELDGPWAAEFLERLERATIKAAREAAIRTNWRLPDHQYEAALVAWIRSALAPGLDNVFLQSFRAFEECIAWAGAQNSLVATLLRLTSPGLPDIYQGSELWEQSMVDPDNRRPIDFDDRRALLNGLADDQTVADLAQTWRDGRVKLALIATMLRFRARHPALFAKGSYEPVRVTESHGELACAFYRRLGDSKMLVAASIRSGLAPPDDSRLALGDGSWEDLLSRARFTGPLMLPTAELFTHLPVAVLTHRC